MDMLFDLGTVQQAVSSYGNALLQLNKALETAQIIKNGIDKGTWSGVSKDRFEQAFQVWITKTNGVVSKAAQLRQAVAECAGDGGENMKRMCENFINCF